MQNDGLSVGCRNCNIQRENRKGNKLWVERYLFIYFEDLLCGNHPVPVSFSCKNCILGAMLIAATSRCL